MILFTDSPFEKMMIQVPNGRCDTAPPVLNSLACGDCPYKGQSPCIGYCIRKLQEQSRNTNEEGIV